MRVVIVTMDSHLAGPADRARERLAAEIPGLELSLHAAAEWAEDPGALERAKADIAEGDIVVANMLFLEEHVQAILPALEARRPHCDALVGIVAASEVVKLTRLGDLDMAKPATGPMALLKRLRGKKSGSGSSGAGQMKMLRRLPKILRFIPGKAQDLRAYFLTMQYWLAGSDENVANMVRFLVDRYAAGRAPICAGASPRRSPSTIPTRASITRRWRTACPRTGGPARREGARGTVGLLLMRSYLLAGDTAHYDAVIAALEARGLRVIPAYAAGLDARPAIDAFFRHEGETTVDAVLSLTGLQPRRRAGLQRRRGGGGHARRARRALSLGPCARVPADADLGGLGARAVAGRGDHDGRDPRDRRGDRAHGLRRAQRRRGLHGLRSRLRVLQGCPGHAALRRADRPPRRPGGAPGGSAPQAAGCAQPRGGALRLPAECRRGVGTAAYLGVFESLWNTLSRCAREGWDVDVPESVDALRHAILEGNAAQYGQEANVAARIPADRLVRETPWLSEIEDSWGPAPGRQLSDGRDAFVLGRQFGRSSSACSPPSATRAIPCAFSSRRTSRPPMPSPPSTAICARISGRTRCCISGCTARWSSCRASRSGHPRPAGRTG